MTFCGFEMFNNLESYQNNFHNQPPWTIFSIIAINYKSRESSEYFWGRLSRLIFCVYISFFRDINYILKAFLSLEKSMKKASSQIRRFLCIKIISHTPRPSLWDPAKISVSERKERACLSVCKDGHRPITFKKAFINYVEIGC